jgi:pyruvate dehydrogenase E2 component (dihydrolipoamide acetyltransferase)
MPTEVIMPNLGMISGGSIILRWRVNIGDQVVPGQVLFEAESEKAMVEIESACKGLVLQLLANPGEMIPFGQVIALIGEPGAIIAEEATPPAEPQQIVSNFSLPESPIRGAQSEGRVVISPAARKLALEAGIDISLITGSGPNGRIVEADVRSAIEKRQGKTG